MLENINSMELSPGDILSDSWILYKKHAKTIFRIVLIVYIPINIVMEHKIYEVIIDIVEGLFGILATMGIAFVIESSIKGQDISYQDALKRSSSRWLSGVWTQFLSGIIISCLLLLLIVPGIIWTVNYTFSIYIVALRNTEGKEALDYSKSLAKNRWWKVFGISILFGLMNGFVNTAISKCIEILPSAFISYITLKTICDLIQAFSTIALIILFLNLDYLNNKEYQE